MLKKIAVSACAVLFLVNMYGCIALLAGAAGGAGTAMWLSGKLSQEVNATFERAVKAARNGLGSLDFKITKETTKDNVAQLISNYTDGRTIWVDVRRITDVSSRIEVRVGASSDKAAARKILDRILKYL